MQIGEGFHQQDTVFLRGGKHFLHLRFAKCQRFFAQNMFLRLQGFDGPFAVDIVGQGDIDRLHFRIGQQFVIAAVGLLKAELLLIAFCLFDPASGDRIPLAVFCQHHAGNRLAPGDIRCSQHTPFHFFHTGSPFFSDHGSFFVILCEFCTDFLAFDY